MLTDYLNPNSGASDVAKKWEIINAAKTLSSEDSGKCFGVEQDSAYEITLPKAADAGAGWNASWSRWRCWKLS